MLLPVHLRRLAQVDDEVKLDVPAPVTLARVLDAVELRYPMLRGTIRAHGGGPRRDFIRFFVCEEDWSHEPVMRELPAAVTEGREAVLVIGAMAGGVTCPDHDAIRPAAAGYPRSWESSAGLDRT